MPSVSRASVPTRHLSALLRLALVGAAVTIAALGGACAGAETGTGVIPGDSAINGGGNSGGGGGGGGGTTLVPPQTIDAFGQSVIDEINRERRKVALDTLVVDGRLVAAAQLQADQIVASGVFDHVIAGAKYPTVASRVDATGFPWSSLAEDLGQTFSVAKPLVASWMAQTSDRANLLNATFTRAGVAEAWATNGTQYSVLVLGATR